MPRISPNRQPSARQIGLVAGDTPPRPVLAFARAVNLVDRVRFLHGRVYTLGAAACQRGIVASDNPGQSLPAQSAPGNLTALQSGLYWVRE